jgi:hypothetical protein
MLEGGVGLPRLQCWQRQIPQGTCKRHSSNSSSSHRKQIQSRGEHLRWLGEFLLLFLVLLLLLLVVGVGVVGRRWWGWMLQPLRMLRLLVFLLVVVLVGVMEGRREWKLQSVCLY